LSEGGGAATAGGSGRRDREWSLPAAAGLAALETTMLIAVIAFGSYRAAPALIGFLAVKYLFCWGLLRRRPGAWMALLLWEASGVIAALSKPGLPVIQRLLEVSVAGVCLVLLGAAASTFPSPELPPR
jgi:energy-converting hydrogenase Eha subunit E